LEDSLRVKGDGKDPSYPYENAVKPFFEMRNPKFPDWFDTNQFQTGTMFLRSLFDFSDTVRFVADDTTGSIRLYADFVEFRIEMPSVERFRNHRFSYPNSVDRLISSRNLLAERFVDYELLSGIDQSQQTRLALMLMSGLGKSGSRITTNK